MATNKQKAKLGALTFVAAKAGQKIARDLGEVVTRHSWDKTLSGSENLLRIGSGVAGAYILMKVSDMAEGSHVPKWLRGLPTAVLSVAVPSLAIYYFGEDLGMQEGRGLIEISQEVCNNYIDALKDILSRDSETHAGYLAGGLLMARSVGRFAYNAGKTIMDRWERKSQENKMNEER